MTKVRWSTGVLAFALAACGGEAITAPITLPPPDAQLLYQDIQLSFQHAEINTRHGTGGANGLGRPSLDCDGGGSVAFYGTDYSDMITARYTVDAVYDNCNTGHFVVNGTYHQNLVASDSGLKPFQTVGGTGDVAVTRLRDGTAGLCSLDFHLTVAYNGIFADGEICGAEATDAFTGDGNHTTTTDVTWPNLRRLHG